MARRNVISICLIQLWFFFLYSSVKLVEGKKDIIFIKRYYYHHWWKLPYGSIAYSSKVGTVSLKLCFSWQNMTPVLKYVFKNSAFAYIFRGLLCSCTLPVHLTSFLHQPFANYSEDLPFFPPHFYQPRHWMKDLQD